LKRRSNNEKGVPYALAFFYSGQRDVETAFEWLEVAFYEHDAELTFLKMEPQFKPLHGDPRWKEILTKIGFSEEAIL